jgi:REP element-mobilizing transposase RayT
MYDPDIHQRQSLRWRKRDYSAPGSYYVTVCLQDHRCLLGNVSSGVMNLNDAGRMVEAEWLKIPTGFPTLRLGEHITMPNHFHGIIEIVGNANVGASLVGTLASARPTRWAGTRPAPTLGDAVGVFKSITTNEYISGVHQFAWPSFQNRFWQRNYYDHVIRDPDELEKIREYIRENPLRWTCDRYNPENPVLVIDESGELVPWDQS